LRGDVTLVQFLIEQGFPLEAPDNAGNTPLSDAVLSRHKPVAMALVAAGASWRLAARATATVICQAAARGDIEELKWFLDAGMDFSTADYDNRTAVHVAANLGHIECVKFLLENGALPNATDVMGNTPLSDAMRGATDAKRHIQQLLLAYGGKESSNLFLLRNSFEFRHSLAQSLPLLCERGGYIYAEVWIPTDNMTSLIQNEWWIDVSHKRDDYHRLRAGYMTKALSGLAEHVLLSRQPVVLSDLESKELEQILQGTDLKSVLAIPLNWHNDLLAVVLLLGDKEQELTEKEVNTFANYASGFVMSGYRTEVIF